MNIKKPLAPGSNQGLENINHPYYRGRSEEMSMDGKDILQKYRLVIREMMRDVAENSVPYITVTACQDYCIALSDGAELTIMDGKERIEEARR
ncbi:hypothetical protein [Blautia marasmi]|uniref:hypothetical protein n=1 Tax=Blautia marasmi TaxID=1917868 RepID=UPI00266BFCF5|nr:hypothetical protein [Blautia marasmi]